MTFSYAAAQTLQRAVLGAKPVVLEVVMQWPHSKITL